MKSIVKDNCKPLIMLVSDGGPDHRVTFHSVQVSLISVFKPLESSVNPVERFMSLLNLVY